AIRALGAQGDHEATAPLIDLAKDDKKPPRERALAIRALDGLGAHGEREASKVAEVTSDEVGEVALAASEYLARAPRKIAVPYLLRFMNSDDATIRERAHASLLARTDVAIQPDVDPFGYDPSPTADRDERSQALRKWREWWDIHQDR